MTKPLRLFLAAASLSACGYSLSSGREAAAQRSCAYFQKCSQLGAGLTYPSLEECLTQQRSFWTTTWPAATCEAAFSSQAVDVCLSSIDTSRCGNAGDFLLTLGTCSAGRVCTTGG